MKPRPWAVPLLPFLFSLALSLATAGPRVFWQDSGFYLTAVHEFSVLYPHGFVLYLALCKAWTALAAPLLGFTGAVHAFSALCAAGAAACLALACRAVLRRIEPEGRHELASIGAACLVASGYAFWHAAILAKTYALYYLAASALLWLLAAAERKRDFAAAAVVLGLCWAAHPSAVLLLPVVLACAWARRDRLREFGWGFFAAIGALAAACALVPSLFLPLLASSPSPYHFDAPSGASGLFSYLRGSRYTDGRSAFGFERARLLHASVFFWEEYLAVPLLLLGLGAARLARVRPRLLALLAVWVTPIVGTALAFRAEGQLDQWLVSAYLPLTILLAVGLRVLHSKQVYAAAAVLVAGLAWHVAANASDLTQRRYSYAEDYGRLLLRRLPPNSFLFVTYDDSIATASWLQSVVGERTDVGLVVGARLGLPWYDRALPGLISCRIPDWERSYRAMPGIPMPLFELHAFANENVAPGRPLYCELDPDPRFLRRDLAVVPSGILWKIAVREEAVLDPADWEDGVDLDRVAREQRRARGVFFRAGPDGSILSDPEPYERRLLLRVMRGRLQLADRILDRDPKAALGIYDSARRVWPKVEDDGRFQLQWGIALLKSGRPADAEAPLKTAAGGDSPPRSRSLACYYLGEIARSAGRAPDAREWFERALRGGGLADDLRARVEEVLKQP